MPYPPFTALLDACVLFPQTVRDVILSLANKDIYRARWSTRIEDEWYRSMVRRYPDHPLERIERTRKSMRSVSPDWEISGYEELIPGLSLPDPDDRHVLAAAIAGRADVIVTMNLRHFPPDCLAQWSTAAQCPDQFAVYQIGVDLPAGLDAMRVMRSRWKRSNATVDDFLELVAKTMPQTADLLRTQRDKLRIERDA